MTKEAIEELGIMVSIMAALFGFFGWLINRREKRDEQKRQELKQAEARWQAMENKMNSMVDKMLSLESHYGQRIEEIVDDVNDVKKDLYSLLKDFLFKK